jgi:hypothetical protein
VLGQRPDRDPTALALANLRASSTGLVLEGSLLPYTDYRLILDSRVAPQPPSL